VETLEGVAMNEGILSFGDPRFSKDFVDRNESRIDRLEDGEVQLQGERRKVFARIKIKFI
jgi:hypothetical protein